MAFTGDLTANPWVVNAADVAGLAAVSGSGNNPGDVISVSGVFYFVVWRGACHVYQIELQKYIADTDVGIVTRYNTKPFADLNGAADLSTVRTGNAGWTGDGLLIPNNGITNGSLRIYHK
jgi:hypothetical protein